MEVENCGLCLACQPIYLQELIDSLCEDASGFIRISFLNQIDLWKRFNSHPCVEYVRDIESEHLLIKYSMIFRSSSGAVHKAEVNHRIYNTSVEIIETRDMQTIFRSWTHDFIERVARVI